MESESLLFYVLGAYTTYKQPYSSLKRFLCLRRRDFLHLQVILKMTDAFSSHTNVACLRSYLTGLGSDLHCLVIILHQIYVI
jgi:hypothetical protein